MSATLAEAAARGIGNIRLGDRPMPGQGRVVDALAKWKVWRSGNLVMASPWPNIHFEVDLADRIQRQMWAGVYEEHVRRCFGALLHPGDVYVDVGGHIGYHAVAAAYLVGAKGQVIAFEADSTMYQRLARNLEQFPWAHPVHAAVWHSSGMLTFERTSERQESGWGTLTTVRDLGMGEHVEVRAVSLDDSFDNSGLTRWDAMKLDAEGSEPAVLRGAEKALERFRPFLVLEINGIVLKEARFSPADIVEFLEARGYCIYHLSHSHLEPWDSSKHVEFCEVLCLPREREAADLERLVRAGFSRPR